MAAVRALTAASPVAEPIACFTRGVTSRIEVTTSACWPGHSFSSARDSATKPLASMSFPGDERSERHSATQCWLVKISPSGETKLAEQPPVSRTAASRTRSSQAWSGAQPWTDLTFADGKASKAHMPSSARASDSGKASVQRKAAARLVWRITHSPPDVALPVHEKGPGASASSPFFLDEAEPSRARAGCAFFPAFADAPRA